MTHGGDCPENLLTGGERGVFLGGGKDFCQKGEEKGCNRAKAWGGDVEQLHQKGGEGLDTKKNPPGGRRMLVKLAKEFKGTRTRIKDGEGSDAGKDVHSGGPIP